MMKYSKFVLLTSLYIFLVYILNQKQGSIPPIGSFLSPFTGYLQNATAVNEPATVEIKTPAISKEAKVLLDEFLIPHIFAASESDLYYLQGYMTARDRLWQMDLQTRAAEGRLSEIIGPKTLNMDREKRRNGLKFAAENAADKMMDSKTKMVLEAYTKGVNDYIASLDKKDLPLEYKLLDYAPEPWKPERSALLLKAMAERLTAMEADIENTNFRQYFGEPLFDLLFPNYVEEQSPIIPKGTIYAFEDSTHHNPKITYSGQVSYRPLEKPERHLGSNNWAVAPNKSLTNHTMLCNDPHLFLNYPSIWYEMHLVCGAMNVYGVTMPGAPGIIIGFNKDIAWGVTNAGRDVRNWYAIKYKDTARNQYAYNGGWRKLIKRIEAIKIRGQETFYDTVLYTHHGPIVYDRAYNNVKDKVDLALSWTAHQSSNELMTFYLLNHAKNHVDYLAAVDHFVCPGQNFVFASASGDIAIKQQGKFPKTETNADKFVLDGSIPANDMNSFIPVEQNPFVINPARGFVSSANQHPTDESYPYYYSSGEFEYNRSRRINEVLESKAKLSISDMMQLQQDEFNYAAYDLLPSLISIIDSTPQSKNNYLGALRKWDFVNTRESRSATYFESWLNYLKKLTWDEVLDKQEMLNIPDNFITARLVRNRQDIDMFDYKKTKDKKEGMKDIVQMAFDSMVLEMKTLERQNKDTTIWSRYKGTEITHMAKIAPFSTYNIQIGGNANIVNAVAKTWGPSWRMIVELTPQGPKAYGIYPGGQSGNPGSKHYNEFTEPWRVGSYRNLQYVKKASELKNVTTIFTFKNN